MIKQALIVFLSDQGIKVASGKTFGAMLVSVEGKPKYAHVLGAARTE